MKSAILTALLALIPYVCAFAEERGYTITFGAETASTQPLENATFINAVTAGKTYIESVTSVVNVFPEIGSVKLSSSAHDGKFNIHLAPQAQIIPEYFVINAARYNNKRDADASITLNSQTVYIDDTEFQDYVITVGSIAPRPVEALTVDASHRVYIRSITVVYDSANGDVPVEKPVVATPEIIPGGGEITTGTAVTITCPTPGAEIHYSIDGSVPSMSSDVYVAPVFVHSDLTVKAVAYCRDMTPSAVASATFTVVNSPAAASATFNFADPASLNPALPVPALKEGIDLDGKSFTQGNAGITFRAGTSGNTHVRLYHSYDAGCDVRVYDGETMNVFVTNPAMKITSITFAVSESGDANADFSASTGYYDIFDYTWLPDSDEPVREVTLTSALQSRFTAVTVNTDIISGVREISYDRDEPATYFDIEGRRVETSNPAPGFYIRVSADEATKVIIR